MLFTIRDIENLSGIKAHTIRIWEQRYTFLKPKRSDTNIRYYSNEELRVILNIAILNKYGYKISHINKMSPEVMFESVLTLTNAEAKENITVNQLLACMADFDVLLFENILSNYIEAAGVEKTILQIIFPFMEKVGVLWLTNNLNPAREHLISNVIRQKIIAGIDSIPLKLSSSKKVCLFLPQGEYHEISLLYVFLLLRKKGVHVFYLGSNVSMDELNTLASNTTPDYLYTHITTAGQSFNLTQFLSTLQKDFKNFPVVISGRAITSYDKKIPPRIIVKRSINEVKEFITNL